MTLKLASGVRRRLAADYFLKNPGNFRKLSPMSYRRRLATPIIPKLSPLTLLMTDISTVPSLRPAEGSMTFKILSKEGNMIEALDQDLKI
jgi:hypothetical protein